MRAESMSYAQTGSDGETAKTKQIGLRVAPLAEVIDSGLSIYGTYDTGSGSPEERGRGTRPYARAGSHMRSQKPDRQKQERRDVLRRLIARATSETDGMAHAAEQQDATRLSNLSYKLRDTLQELWDLRSDREDDWGDILNTLQIAMEGREIGDYTIAQCRAISRVIADHLALYEVDGDDVEQSVLVLVESGLDPWKGTDEGGSSKDNAGIIEPS
jgi:hypothetical protein